MELRQIQTFLTLAQTQSFSGAARLLGYSQSAVTVQIRQLEAELGIRLFDRMGKGVSLTPKGAQFSEYAANIMREINRSKAICTDDGELHNPLHIGVLESLCCYKLPPILRDFRQNHPRVPLRITTASPRELIAMMEANQLDLIYILDRPRHNPEWNKVLEVEESIVFVAPAGYLPVRKEVFCLEELMGYPFYLTEQNENYRKELDDFLESKGMSITPFLEASSTEFIMRVLRENGGISYLPYFAVEKAVAEGSLSLLPVSDFKRVLYRQIFYHKHKWESPEMEHFIRLALQEDPPGTAPAPDASP